MIIEAGYDIRMLMQPELLRDAESRRALWLVGMDEDLRLVQTTKVCDEVSEDLSSHAEDVTRVLAAEDPPIRYFALIHMVDFARETHAMYFFDQDKQFETAGGFEEHAYLGRYVYDDEYTFQTAPRYSFRDYIGLDHLPRLAIVPGPHSFECSCAACSYHEERLRRGRERYQAQLAERGDEEHSLTPLVE